MCSRLHTLLIASFLIVGCDKKEVAKKSDPLTIPVPGVEAGAVSSVALAERENPGNSDHLFEKISAEDSGIDFVHGWEPRDEGERDLITTSFAGGGVALGDIDNDGLPEIFLTHPDGKSRLYRNLGGFKFEDITEATGIATELSGHWSISATFVDIQGDGLLDLYVCGYRSAIRLFVNTGTGKFKERADEFGLGFSGASIMMSFAADDVLIDVQSSTDLRNWATAQSTMIESTSQGDGTAIETWAVAPSPGSPGRLYLRVAASSR